MNLAFLSIAKPFIFLTILAWEAGFFPHIDNEKQVDNIKKEITATHEWDVQQERTEIGVGPFKTVDLGKEVNMTLAEQGKILYESRCTACHKLDDRFIGPSLSGITKKRNPVWIMNMIINPSEMVEKDPIAKELLAEYKTPMINMGVNEEETRSILEYLRAYDEGKLK